MAVPVGSEGEALVQRTFAELEAAVHAARSYRGKILSLEGGAEYRGRSRGITVHRLPTVGRNEVILPEETLRLLDRNAVDFVGNRSALRKLGQSTRKGILLYGPPGTGKTHTIRYLATNLPGHTTLIVTAEQMGLLGAYMNLARLLQPSMVVIEDVDLIARDREKMSGCEEPLLNKLLNEMDGLKGEADILFVLTTNRPEQLESALAGRPGRIDQAIEVPLPDAIGHDKLVRLYGKGLSLNAALVDETVRRTSGVSAAFIKELMRRIFEQHPAFPRNAYGGVTNQWVDQILSNPIYAGYIEAPKWKISLRKGQHAGLISLETHQRAAIRDERVCTRARRSQSRFPPARNNRLRRVRQTTYGLLVVATNQSSVRVLHVLQ